MSKQVGKKPTFLDSQNVDKCAGCFQALIHVEPKKLSCDHIICQQCVDRLKTETKIQCPKCNGFSDLKNIKTDLRTHESKSSTNQAQIPKPEQGYQNEAAKWDKCSMCAVKTAARSVVHWCECCAQVMCEDCKMTHSNTGHVLTSIAEQEKTIKDSFTKQLLHLNENSTRYQTFGKSLQNKINGAINTQTTSLRKSKDLRTTCINKVNLLFDSFDAHILNFTTKHIEEFEKEKKAFELQLNQIEANKKALEDGLKKEGSQLLHDAKILIESTEKFIESIKSAEVQIDQPKITIAMNEDWDFQQLATLELAYKQDDSWQLEIYGAQNRGPSVQKGRQIVTLSDVGKCKWIKKEELELTSGTHALRILGNELWCCHDDGITVYDRKLEVLSSIQYTDMGAMYDVAQMGNSDLVVAAENGLYHLNSNGNMITRIVEQRFSSVRVHGEKVYLAPCKVNGIRVYEMRNKAWARTERIQLPCETTIQSCWHWVTLSVSANHIQACCNDCNKHYVLSTNGKVLHLNGTAGSTEPGKFNGCYITDGDDVSSLIADHHNNRLQVMSTTGESCVVNLQPSVARPRCAVHFHDELYVVSPYDEKMYKFVKS